MIFSALIVVLFLIAINALYVAAEFAAVGVRRSRIRQLAQEGNSLAVRLLPWLEDGRKLDEYVAACQIGITFSSLVLGAYSQATLAAPLAEALAQWGGLDAVLAKSTAAAIVLFSLTGAQVVLGELAPKSLALQYPGRTALYTSLPLRWSLKVFSGFITLMNGSAVILLKLLGVPYTRHRHIHSPEEIEMLIAESRDGGVLEPEEHLRLQRALSLRMRPAHQLMVPRLHMSAIDYDAPVDQVLQQIAKSPYSHLPVYRESIDNVIGMVHAKDVVVRYIQQGNIQSIQEVMRPIMSVPEHLTADSLLSTLRQRRTHQAVVVDEFGGTEGLITLEDVLSEMLGEVADEFKMEQPQPEVLPDGRVRLPGSIHLHEAEPWLGVLWKGQNDTISGHITEILGDLPVEGQLLSIDGVDVEIERVKHHVIVSILATPVPAIERGAHD